MRKLIRDLIDQKREMIVNGIKNKIRESVISRTKKKMCIDIPKAGSRPCSLHPEDIGVPSHLKRCGECLRIQRRVRHALNGELPSTVYKDAKGSARRRGIEFTLTFKQFDRIIHSPCVYQYGAAISGIGRMSIDRIDPSKGYTPKNSQPCCSRHNLMKSNILTHEQMMDAVSRYSIACGSCGAGRKRISTIGLIKWSINKTGVCIERPMGEWIPCVGVQ